MRQIQINGRWRAVRVLRAGDSNVYAWGFARDGDRESMGVWINEASWKRRLREGTATERAESASAA